MTEQTPNSEPSSESTPESMPTSTPVAAPSRRGVPAWAAICGAAAAGLVVVAGVGGYALGQASVTSQRVEAAPADGAPSVTPDRPGQPGEPGEPGDGAWGDGDMGRGDGDMGRGRGDRDGYGMPDMPMPIPQNVSPEDIQRLLDLLMQSGGGGTPQGYSQGS